MKISILQSFILMSFLVFFHSTRMSGQSYDIIDEKPDSHGLYRVHIHGKVKGREHCIDGLIDKNGNEVFRCNVIYGWYGPLCKVSNKDIKNSNKDVYGCINDKGQVIIPIKYDYIDEHSDNDLILVEKDGKCAFMNKKGEHLTEYKYIRNPHNTLATWDKHGWLTLGNLQTNKCGIIDKQLNVIIPFNYDGIYCYSKDLFVILKDGKYGCIDAQEKEILPPIYESLHILGNMQNAVVCNHGTLKIIDLKGNVVTPLYEYNQFGTYGPDYLILQRKSTGKWGAIDLQGKTLVPFKYSEGFEIDIDKVLLEKKKLNPPSPVPVNPSTDNDVKIEWLKWSTIINDQQYKLQACIKSSKQIKKVDVYLNGQKVSRTRDMYVEKDDDCDYSVNQILTLQPGENTIKIEVTNTDGVSSEEKVVTYNPPTPAPVIPTEKRLALVIGNNKYTNTRCFPELRNAINDAKAVHARLKLLGFEVEPIVLDANKTAMWNAIENFINKAERYDVALIYYSGHGLSPDGGANYLIPTDANINYLDEVKKDGINSQTQLIARLEEKNCKVKIALLDCCNNCNVPERGTKSAVFHGGLSKMNPEGVFILHAASPGKKAEDGSGNNSPFVEALLECTDKYPNLLWESFVKKVRESVIQKTSERQKPYYEGVIDGEFYFNKK